MPTTPQRILFAGGGTGGHVFPIVNLLQHIQKEHSTEARLYWTGLADSLEQKEASKMPSVRFLTIRSGKLRREKSLRAVIQNIQDIFFLLVGVIQALYYLTKNKIDVVFCKGGYVALPVVIATIIMRKKLIVHESDTRFGLTNRIALRRAHEVFTAFDFPSKKVEVVGQLLSADLAYDANREEFQDLLSTQTSKDTTHVLVMGGSQGARSLYTALADVVRQSNDFQQMHFIVISGLLNKDIGVFDQLINISVLDFVDQKTMAILLKYSDIGVVRAGTTSLAEQKIWDLRLIMVPLPRTHDQQTNAEYYVHEHNDELVIQNENLPLHLSNTLREYLGYHKELKERERKKIIAAPKERVVKSLLYTN